jgi:hypothetical protein
MKTRFKLTAAAVLFAAFAGASASETVVDEMVVIGQRATSTLEVGHPAAPQATLESFTPAIALPAIDVALVAFGADNG